MGSLSGIGVPGFFLSGFGIISGGSDGKGCIPGLGLISGFFVGIVSICLLDLIF